MKHKNTIFYQGKKEVKYNFSAEEITSDGALILIKKIEKKNKVIKNFASSLTDKRNNNYTCHTLEKLISQRIFGLVQGYSDCNDADYLSNDPVFKLALGGDLASQSTLSRLENSISIKDVFRISENLVQSYINTIDIKRKQIIIDVDGTDDPTHGDQQLTMFNGYYKQYMYHQLLFHDGQTGQLILPVLRPGNCHSNKWFVAILKRIVQRIKQRRPELKIIVRGDCGFSSPEFYQLAELEGLEFCIGITTNERLKKQTALMESRIRAEYLCKNEKIQMFVEPFLYQAESWEKPQTCYAKVESTGRGMNIRYICSNMKTKSAKDLYKDFYVMRGDASENRIKELKNMCFADRLSCHKFTANYFRLFLSALTYELFYKIKCLIKQSSNDEAKKWQIDNIRLYLMKVGATVENKAKSIIIKYSKSYVCKDLFAEVVQLCH